jgi:hypothetical protein
VALINASVTTNLIKGNIMNKYTQNHFNESAIAKESESNKAIIIVTSVLFLGLCAAFKYAIGG